jgi:hypothetical protein
MQRNNNPKLKATLDNFFERKLIEHNSQKKKEYFKLEKEENNVEVARANTNYLNDFLESNGFSNSEEYLKEIRENTWSIFPKLNECEEENISQTYMKDKFVDGIPTATVLDFGLSFNRETLQFLDKFNCNIESVQVKPEPHSNVLVLVFTDKINHKVNNSSACTIDNNVLLNKRADNILSKMNISMGKQYEISFNYPNKTMFIDFNSPLN